MIKKSWINSYIWDECERLLDYGVEVDRSIRNGELDGEYLTEAQEELIIVGELFDFMVKLREKIDSK